MEMTMGMFAALDVSQEETATYLVRGDGAFVAEAKVPTCPDAIADWLVARADALERVGMEAGPLAVWLWERVDRAAGADRLHGCAPRKWRAEDDAERPA